MIPGSSWEKIFSVLARAKKAAMMFNYSALILDKDYYACLDLEENAAQEKPAA